MENEGEGASRERARGPAEAGDHGLSSPTARILFRVTPLAPSSPRIELWGAAAAAAAAVLVERRLATAPGLRLYTRITDPPAPSDDCLYQRRLAMSLMTSEFSDNLRHQRWHQWRFFWWCLARAMLDNQ